MLTIFVILPLGCAFLVPLAGRLRLWLVRALAVCCGAGLLYYSVSSIWWLKTGIKVYAMGGWRPPFGICLVLDGMTVLMLLVVNIVGFLSLVYSLDYARKYTSERLYYTLFCLLLAGLNGVVISGDLFNLFVFLEITSIASYALVAFGVEAEELEASFKYLVLGSVASSLVLLGIGMLFGAVSTLNMADISRSLNPAVQGNLILYALALFTAGLSLKAGFVPFHAWLPDAHPSAPAPMSAMLSGVVIKTIGIYAFLRVIFNIVGFSPALSAIFIWLGILSMIVGVILAIGQWDFKRLLAYHSVSQVGYVIFAVGLGTPLGIIGGLFHLLNHSLFKSLLFLNAGSLEYAGVSRRLDLMEGSRDNMPVTSATSLVASLSIAGIPPFCGFWSKLIIVIAAFQAGHYAGAAVCIAVSLVTLASFLKVQKYAFIRKAKDAAEKAREAPLSMKFSMLALALLCILAGLFFVAVVNHLILPAAEALLAGKGYANSILGAAP